MHRALRTATGERGIEFVDGSGLATALMGDAIASNLFMLGYAWQQGLVPLSRRSEKASLPASRTRRSGSQYCPHAVDETATAPPEDRPRMSVCRRPFRPSTASNMS